MSSIKYALLAPLMAISALTIAAEPVDQQQDVAANPNVSVKVQRGNIEFIRWDNNSIQVKGELDELSEGFIFDVKGNTVVIEDKLPRSYQGNNKQGSQLTIYLPTQLSLDAEGVSADFALSQLNGQIAIALVSGNIEAKQLSGSNKLTTVSGNINSEQLSGKIKLETVSGDIDDKDSKGEAEFRLVSGELDTQSDFTQVSIDQVSGDIEATLSQINQINMVTISGDANLNLGAQLSKGHLETISGDLTMAFSAAPNLNFMIDGGPGGKINNQLTDDKPIKQKYSSSQSLQFKSLSGDGQVNINTISGRISVK